MKFIDLFAIRSRRLRGYITMILIALICCSCLILFQCSGHDNSRNENVQDIGNKFDSDETDNELDSNYYMEVDEIVDGYLARLEKSYNEYGGFPPEGGIVPDKETAQRIAEAVWLPLYGKTIYDQRPYRIRLVNDSIWIVHGHYRRTPPFQLDGIVYAKIRKSDGKILLVLRE